MSTNLLSFLLICVVLIQSYIYYQQRVIMGVAVDPRLRITRVRVEDFEAGKQAVFIVSIINEGATDATNVDLDIRVNLPGSNLLALKWSHPQNITIPAGQEQHYFVPWTTPLDQQRFNVLIRSDAIKVSGYFKLGDSEQRDFCYRYYPWQGKRPEGVSQFIPCDFDPGLTHVVKARDEIKASEEFTLTKTRDDNQKEEEAKKEPPS